MSFWPALIPHLSPLFAARFYPIASLRFRDLVARLQILVPSDWASTRANELDEQSGAPLTAWRADAPAAKQQIRVYLAGDAVALHISAHK